MCMSGKLLASGQKNLRTGLQASTKLPDDNFTPRPSSPLMGFPLFLFPLSSQILEATLGIYDNKVTESNTSRRYTTTPRETVRAGRRVEKAKKPPASTSNGISNPSSRPPCSCLLRWEKEHNETRPSLGVLTTSCRDYDYPAVAMPTVMSFLYHPFWVDFFFPLFSKGYPRIQCLEAHWELQPSSYLDPRKPLCLGTSGDSVVPMGTGKS